MDILIYLIPIALSLGVLGLVGFLWTMRHNQYEDLDGAAWRILFDDDEADDLSPRRSVRSGPENASDSDPKN